MAVCAQAGSNKPDYPFAGLPELPGRPSSHSIAPSDEECMALWDKYAMLDNVRAHSLEVANIATALAEQAYSLGHAVDVAAVRAAALLHDIAKTWCIRNGGSHAVLGGAWVAQETGDYPIAQGVILHVHWPWQVPQGAAICRLPIFVLYADKRVRHDQRVRLGERFDDLMVRYGKTEAARDSINVSWQQARQIEQALATQLNWSLDEDSLDCWRLVK